MTVETFDEVKRIVAKSLQVPIEQLTNDTRLEDLGAEFLDVIEIVYDIEEKFRHRRSDYAGRELARARGGDTRRQSNVKLETIGDIARAVQSLVDAKSRR